MKVEKKEERSFTLDQLNPGAVFSLGSDSSLCGSQGRPQHIFLKTDIIENALEKKNGNIPDCVCDEYCTSNAAWRIINLRTGCSYLVPFKEKVYVVDACLTYKE